MQVKRAYPVQRAPGCQWQALPSPVQCEETATRTRDLPVTGGKTLPLAPGKIDKYCGIVNATSES
jgi:hypothetical protein